LNIETAKREPPGLTDKRVVVGRQLSSFHARLDVHGVSPFPKLLRFFPLSLTAQNNDGFNHPRVK
jgi:hypothetical protein